ncbi:DUF1772 domain-containing protein [soil metagenome]
MNAPWIRTVVFGSVLACGMVAGILFAFSSFVMQALSRLPSERGIAAMQAINVSAVNVPFMALFMGCSVANLVVGVLAATHLSDPGTKLLLVASLLYLLGCFLVTVAFNIPLNDALAVVKPESSEASQLWQRYLPQWMLWNHIRTLFSFLAAAAYLSGLLALSK